MVVEVGWALEARSTALLPPRSALVIVGEVASDAPHAAGAPIGREAPEQRRPGNEEVENALEARMKYGRRVGCEHGQHLRA